MKKRDSLALTHTMYMSLVYVLIRCDGIYLQRFFHSWVNIINTTFVCFL